MSTIPEVKQTVAVPQRPSKIRVSIIVILFISLLVAYLDRINVSIIIADTAFKTEMGIMTNPTAQGLLMSFFLFAYGAGMFVLGGIGDWLGPRKAVIISILSWCVAVTMGGFARTLNFLFASRLILGLGEAMHWPMMSKYTKNWIPSQERGRANAGWTLGLFIGPAFAMPFFAWLVAEGGWRASYWFCAAVGLVILPLIWWTTDHPHQHKGVNKEELDYIEAGLKEEREQERNAAKANVWANIKQLVTNFNFILNMLTYWGSAIMWWGFMAWLPAYLKAARGFSWSEMGWLSALPYVLGAIGAILYGHVSDKYSKRRALYSVGGMIGLTLFTYLGATVQDNLSSAYCMAMAMFCMGVHIPNSWTILQKIVPANLVGTAAGVSNGTSQFIGAFTPAIVGYIIGITGSYIGGLMFMVAAGLFGTFFVSILAIRKI